MMPSVAATHRIGIGANRGALDQGLPQLSALELHAQRLAFVLRQRGAEMQQGRRDVNGLEVGLPACKVDEAAGRKCALVVENEPDAPSPLLDRIVALAAFGLTGRRALGTVDTLQPTAFDTGSRDALQSLAVSNITGDLQRLQHGFGTLVRGASRME